MVRSIISGATPPSVMALLLLTCFGFPHLQTLLPFHLFFTHRNHKAISNCLSYELAELSPERNKVNIRQKSGDNHNKSQLR